MIVTLSHYKNVEVATYAEASKIICADRDARGVGASEWYRKGAGRILVDSSEGLVQVAFVSYNGRVWKGRDDGKLGHEEISLIEPASRVGPA